MLLQEGKLLFAKFYLKGIQILTIVKKTDKTYNETLLKVIRQSLLIVESLEGRQLWLPYHRYHMNIIFSLRDYSSIRVLQYDIF